jgi:hypothetical protein
MKRISSRQTWFIKRLVPVFWLAGIAALAAVYLTGAARDVAFLLVPAFMAVLGVYLYRQLFWPLADSVDDAGDTLIVRRGEVEERVRLDNVMNVAQRPVNPPQVSLRLRVPGRFGDEIVFLSASGRRFGLFARDPVVEDLLVRVDRARGGARA